MGELLERVDLSKLVYGNGLVENFKNNSLFFYDKYRGSEELIRNVRVGDIRMGRFYFLHYRDDSNWMRYSPIFTVSVKKFDNLIILLAVNFNFIPLQIRITVFDKFIKKENFDKNISLEVDYEGVYKELLQWGFEYSIVEYNLAQINSVHSIDMSMLPRFLLSQHPKNIYDPLKLYEIWKAKLYEHGERHQEMTNLIMKDLFDIKDDLKDEYSMLKDHISRVKRSYQKYGK
jgi:hypothetical protein